MKEIAGGKQMKSVWQILPPDKSEKRHGKHPTQKPVALLERILLAASDEGDLVLDPFLGGGTTLIAALSQRRSALGCELSADFIALSLRRLCSNLVHVQISAFSLHFDLDPASRSVDRSNSAVNHARVPNPLQLIQQERRFYFIGRTNRHVIFSVLADSLDEARQKFRASGRSDSDALFIIKTETEIYIA
jgi:hypothetical protein